MPSYELARRDPVGIAPAAPRSLDLLLSRQSRALARLEDNTSLRVAGTIAENMVAVAKVQGVVDTAREAATSYTMLRRWTDALASGDVVLADELRLFLDGARIGCAEVLADLVSTYCREGRR